MICSLILYGSRARGDYHESSDVDLLGVVPEGRISGSSVERAVNVHLRPFDELVRKSSEGDLFVCHLVHEGTVLHDSMAAFSRVRESFRWRDSYRPERRDAARIIDYLAMLPETRERPELIKRLVWAMRTLVIADAAEEQAVAFSSRAIADRVGLPHLERVLITRDEPEMRGPLIRMAGQVRRMIAGERSAGSRDREQLERRLLAMGGIAASTVRLVENGLLMNPQIVYE